MQDRIAQVCDLLLGAAYADQQFHERERSVIAELLAKLLDTDSLPEALIARIDAFEPASFELADCAGTFSSDDKKDKLQLIELISAVHEADDEYSLSEDDYVRRVGAALSLDEDELSAYTISYEVETLRDGLSRIRAVPPPIPS